MKKILSVMVLFAMALLMNSVFAADYGDGTEESPILITSQEELLLISDFPDCYFELANDIVLTGNWTPLCTYGDEFTGVLDGKGHTISELQINEFINSGLFAINSGTIKNLNVKTSESGIIGAKTSKTTYTGIIAGVNNGTISKCNIEGMINYENHTKGEKNEELNYDAHMGGVCGENSGIIESVNIKICMNDIVAYYYSSYSDSFYGYTTTYKGYGWIYVGGISGINNGHVRKCNVENNISVKEVYLAYIGGICGKNTKQIEKCIADNNIIIEKSNNEGIIGGICGISNNEKYDTEILFCASRGNMTSLGKSIGGIVVSCGGTISNSYFIGELTGEYAYGIGNGHKMNINNCYSVADNTATSIKGIGGYNNTVVTNSFYDQMVSGATDTGYGTPKSTLSMKMKRTYTGAGWDFEKVWGIDENINDSYPYLLFEYAKENKITFDVELQKATVSVMQDGEYAVIFADYNNNLLVETDIQVLQLKEGKNEISSDLNLSEGDKIFVWNSLLTMKPLCTNENVN